MQVIAANYHIWHRNDQFLEEYYEFVEPEFRHLYFAYDSLSELYDILKKDRNPNILPLELEFFGELRRLTSLTSTVLNKIDRDIDAFLAHLHKLDDSVKEKEKRNHRDRTLEREIRALYSRCKALLNFYELNNFVIRKTAKKYEKIVISMNDDQTSASSTSDFAIWRSYPSFAYFSTKFCPMGQQILNTKQRCVDLYSSVFRETYTSLASDELKYLKNVDTERKDLRLHFGLKMGVIIMLVVWLIADSFVLKSDIDFWAQSGLYVYTTIGNLLFYKLLWSVNVYLWSTNNINYISVLQLSSRTTNLMHIVNQTTTWMLLFFVNVLIYYRSNNSQDALFDTFLRYACPLVLIVCTAVYLLYQRHMTVLLKQSFGLFSPSMYPKFFLPLCVDATFRDIFAADYLTSFTKVISDAAHASCWVGTGSFLVSVHNDKDVRTICTSGSSVRIVASACVLVPLMIRLCQCTRILMAQKKWYPQALNFLKYASSIMVVIWGLFETSGPGYITLIVVASLYKWWWDVVMDWGLFTVRPTCENISALFVEPKDRRARHLAANNRPFLRPLLLYRDNLWIYYVCIFLDLILRFMWTISLVPMDATLPFVKPAALSVFLGSLEIFRRSMWGYFRIEYENVKLIMNDAPGFFEVDNRVSVAAPSYSRNSSQCSLSDGDGGYFIGEYSTGMGPRAHPQDSFFTGNLVTRMMRVASSASVASVASFAHQRTRTRSTAAAHNVHDDACASATAAVAATSTGAVSNIYQAESPLITPRREELEAAASASVAAAARSRRESTSDSYLSSPRPIGSGISSRLSSFSGASGIQHTWEGDDVAALRQPRGRSSLSLTGVSRDHDTVFDSAELGLVPFTAPVDSAPQRCIPHSLDAVPEVGSVKSGREESTKEPAACASSTHQSDHVGIDGRELLTTDPEVDV